MYLESEINGQLESLRKKFVDKSIDFKNVRLWLEKSLKKYKVKDPKIRQAQEYLGHTDEIDARANDLWLEIKHAKKDINCLASLKDLVKDSDTLTGYIATFGDSDHKVVKRLLTRTWKYAKAV